MELLFKTLQNYSATKPFYERKELLNLTKTSTLLDLSLIDFEDNEVLDYYTDIIYLKIPSSYEKCIPNNLNTVIYFEMPYNISVDYTIPNNVLYLIIPKECDADIYNYPKYLLFYAGMDYYDVDAQYLPYTIYIDALNVVCTELFKNLMYIHILNIDYDSRIIIKNQYIQYILLSNNWNDFRIININVNYLSCLDSIINKLDKVIKQTNRPILMRTMEYIGFSRKANIKIEYI
jgi:hypothetical protein